jgi:hypothetical protein
MRVGTVDVSSIYSVIKIVDWIPLVQKDDQCRPLNRLVYYFDYIAFEEGIPFTGMSTIPRFASCRLAESYRGYFIPPRPDKAVVEGQVAFLSPWPQVPPMAHFLRTLLSAARIA